jgi:hypothetical protein
MRALNHNGIKVYRLRLIDFGIPTGDVITNYGNFTCNQFDILMTKINYLKPLFDYRYIKCGCVFYDFDPVKFMNQYK